MATSEHILQKQREYETRVLTAIGFKSSDPVKLNGVDLEYMRVGYKWYGVDTDSLPVGSEFHTVEHQGPITYRLSAAYLSPEQWFEVVAAHREWLRNLPSVTR